MIGGATISFGHLVDFFKKEEVLHGVVDTQPFTEGWLKKLNVLQVMINFLRHLPGADLVMLNSSRGGTRYLAPIVFGLSRLCGKSFVFRPFGGNLKDYTADYGKFQQWIFRHTVLQGDLLFLQTRALLEHYATSGANLAYLPTSRKEPLPALIRHQRPFQKRFIFLGHLKAEKGVDELLAVAEMIPEDYTIHFYGSLAEEKYRGVFREDTRFYQGILSPDDLLPTLSRYDVLVLPTYYEGEGYPGVIIEAFSLGLPVISTQWKAIPEIVRNNETGLLITPGSTEELKKAILSFQEDNYWAFSANARNCFQEKFEEELVLGKVLSNLINLQ